MSRLTDEVDKVMATIALNKSADVIEEARLSSADRSRLQDALIRYIHTDDYWATAQVFHEIIGNHKPLEYIRSVLNVPDTPIPFAFHALPSHSKAQCRRPWSEYEDMRLIAGIHKYGMIDFHLIAKFVGNGRSQWQCRQRWTRGIDPSISKEKWSESEDNDLLEAVKALGAKQWKKVAMRLPNRSDVQCRYRYHLLTRKQSACESEVGSPEETSEGFEDKPEQGKQKIVLPSITTFDPILDSSPFIQMVLARTNTR